MSLGMRLREACRERQIYRRQAEELPPKSELEKEIDQDAGNEDTSHLRRNGQHCRGQRHKKRRQEIPVPLKTLGRRRRKRQAAKHAQKAQEGVLRRRRDMEPGCEADENGQLGAPSGVGLPQQQPQNAIARHTKQPGTESERRLQREPEPKVSPTGQVRQRRAVGKFEVTIRRKAVAHEIEPWQKICSLTHGRSACGHPINHYEDRGLNAADKQKRANSDLPGRHIRQLVAANQRGEDTECSRQG